MISYSEATISKTIDTDFVRFGNVWEDADVLCDALAPSCTKGRILSIASAGDNVLALLTINPKEIIAVDVNRSQLACLELRISAFRHLDYFGLLSFMGITAAPNRNETYQELRPDLSSEAKLFWDNHPKIIQEGIIHIGRFERYLKIFRNYIFPLVHSKDKREALFITRSHPDRLKFYEEQWDTFLWRQLFRLFFNPWIIGNDEQCFDFLNYVQGDASNRLLRRTKHALTELSPCSNPYLTYILKGNYSLEALPRYLRAEFKKTITSQLDRIKLVCAPVQEAAKDGNFDGYNLSDIMESMETSEYDFCYQTLLSHANPKARLVYWDTLHPHDLPEHLKELVNTQSELSEVLHWRDKVWFYQSLHIDELKTWPEEKLTARNRFYS